MLPIARPRLAQVSSQTPGGCLNSEPNDVTLDAVGDLLIVDTTNYLVRFVPVTSGTYFGQSMSADDIYTIVWIRTSGYSGYGVHLTSAKFSNVLDVGLELSRLLD